MAEEFGAREAYRRQVGLVLGGALGLVYGAVSQFINTAFLPGIPFYQPPFGPWGNLGLCILLGAAIGLAAAWSESALIGILSSSALGAAIVLAATLLTGPLAGGSTMARLLSLLFLFFPVFGALAPLVWIIRRAIDRLEQHQREGSAWTHRLAWPVALVLLLAGLGAFSLYRPDARGMLSRMDTLLRTSQSGGALPEPFNRPELVSLPERTAGPYTLQWDRDENNRYMIPRPASARTQAVVVARFEDGYRLACLFLHADDANPRCKEFEPEE